MHISIITPTFNSARTIKDSIDSVLGQENIDLEYIIIDGNSTDETLKTIQIYGNQINKLISEQDEGLYYAMNKGINLATGDIIGILNSDDFYNDTQVLTKVVQAFKDPKIDSVYGDLQYVDPIDTNKVIRHWEAGTYNKDNFLYGWMPPHPTFFVRRSVYEKYGDFDTSLRSSADYELMLRFLYKHQVSSCYIPEVLVKMRAGGVSNASFRHRIRANREDRLAWEKNNLQPKFFTTWMKPVRKIGQFRIFSKNS